MGDRAQTRKPKPSNVRMSAARAAALEESIRKEEKCARPPRWAALQSPWMSAAAVAALPACALGSLTAPARRRRAQGLYLQRLAAADPSLAASLAHEAPSAAGAPPQPPELFETIKAQSLARPDKGSSLDVSRALAQSVNPGFYLRDGAALKSVAKDDFVVDEDEVRARACRPALTPAGCRAAPTTTKRLRSRASPSRPRPPCRAAGVHALPGPAGQRAPPQAQRHEQARGGGRPPAPGGQGRAERPGRRAGSHRQAGGRLVTPPCPALPSPGWHDGCSLC